MLDTAFSHALRVVICETCGAAMQASPEGGVVQCDVCAATMRVRPRDESDATVGLSHSSEEDRIAALSHQDRHPPPLPSDLEELVAEGKLRSDKAEGAMQLWQAARGRLNEGTSTAAEDRFFRLTLLLCEHVAAQRDHPQLRGLLETAADELPSPRYKQVIRCVLAREAARVDDLAAADDWLAPCDPTSYDLLADSVYRVSAGYLQTRKRHYDRALEVLGVRGDELPIMSDLDAFCTVLRSNAHERLERYDDAVVELADGMNRVVGGVDSIEAVLRQHANLNLCRHSFAHARALAHGEGVDGATRVGRPLLSPIVRQALPWAVLSGVFLSLALVTDRASTMTGGQRLDMFFLVMAASFSVPLAILLLRHRRAGRASPEPLGDDVGNQGDGHRWPRE
jgi:hypothetical protein